MNVSQSIPGMDCQPPKQEPQKALQLQYITLHVHLIIWTCTSKIPFAGRELILHYQLYL